MVVARLDRPTRVPFELKKQVHLLVDGYNVILGLPQLKDIFQRDKESSRDELGRIARNIHDANGMRVTLVFDGSGGDHEIVRPGKELTFSYLFSSASASADSLIESLLREASDPSLVTVVTRDRAILHVSMKIGANVMSPDQMVTWSIRSASEEKGQASRTRDAGEEPFGTDLDVLI